MAAVHRVDVPAFWLGVGLILLGTPILIVGCYRRARIKGYRGHLAALGAFSLPGALLLIALPDKNRPRKGFEVVMEDASLPAPPDPLGDASPFVAEILSAERR